MKIGQFLSAHVFTPGLKLLQQGSRYTTALFTSSLSRNHPFADLIARVGIIATVGISGAYLLRAGLRRWVFAAAAPRRSPPPPTVAQNNPIPLPNGQGAPPAAGVIPPLPAPVLPIEDRFPNTSAAPPIPANLFSERRPRSASGQALIPAPIAADAFNFPGLPIDLQASVINFLRPADLKWIRNFSQSSQGMFQLVYSYQAIWRRIFYNKHRVNMPQILANDHLNGREALRFVFQMMRGQFVHAICNGPQNLCLDAQVLRLGQRSPNYHCEQIFGPNGLSAMAVVHESVIVCRFSSEGPGRQEFLTEADHGILAGNDVIYALSKQEFHILYQSRADGSHYIIPAWARDFHELQRANEYLCIGIHSINHNGDFYSYFVLDMTKRAPPSLSSETSPHFYFKDGRSPVILFKHPYIGNKLFFYTQDPEHNQEIYILDLWTDTQQSEYRRIIQHSRPIAHAAFAPNGLELIVRDVDNVQTSYSVS